jgi:excisionase family DNA binding protein
MSAVVQSLESEHPMTVSEVAAFFKCHPETVKRNALKGNLPGFKLGKSWYFLRSEIDKMMRQAIQSRSAIGAAPVEE